MTDELIIGLLSGTSRDGVDAVLVNFTRNSTDLLHAQCTPYPAAIKNTLDQLLETGQPPTEDMTRLLDETLGRFFARVAQDLAREAGMEMRDISAIGSHGQNVWHAPSGAEPVSIQLGNGQLMARNTGVVVVTNFRSADIAAGGQGAPLAPLLHRELFYKEGEHRAVVNIGVAIAVAGQETLSAAVGVGFRIVGPIGVVDRDATFPVAAGCPEVLGKPARIRLKVPIQYAIHFSYHSRVSTLRGVKRIRDNGTTVTLGTDIKFRSCGAIGRRQGRLIAATAKINEGSGQVEIAVIPIVKHP